VFDRTFFLTQAAPADAGVSALQAELGPGTRAPAPGVYNQGLLVVLGAAFGEACFASWPPVQGRARPIAYTALGDVFVWDRQMRFPQLLSVQTGQFVQAGENPADFWDAVIVRQNVVDDILRNDIVPELIRRHGPIAYGECYILLPWRMLGGVEAPENFDRGALEVYLDLVGQTHFADQD
jgi:hypothetical protein